MQCFKQKCLYYKNACIVNVKHSEFMTFQGMVYHIPEALDKYKCLQDIAVHQLERKNMDWREAYFQCSQ